MFLTYIHSLNYDTLYIYISYRMSYNIMYRRLCLGSYVSYNIISHVLGHNVLKLI